MNEHGATDQIIGAQLRGVQQALRRRRQVRLLVRAVWLALLVWCAGLVALLLGVALPLPVLVIAACAMLVGGSVYAVLSQPSLRQLTHGLDRFYHLHEQTATALEVAQRGARNPIEARVVDQAAHWLAELRHYVARLPLVPWREAETLLAVALVALGLTVALGPATPAAQTPVALRDLPPPTVPTAPASAEPSDVPVEQQQPPLPPEAQAAADALAGALGDNGATRSAADALRRGDPGEAASELRELADGADRLSDDARSDIAQGLREAAEQIRGTDPSLAERLEQQADALQQGGQAAEQALEDLARTVDELGNGTDLAQAPGEQPGEQGEQGAGEQGQAPNGDPAAEGEAGGAGPGAGSLPGGETRTTPPDAAQAQGSALPLPSGSALGGATTDAQGPQGPSIEIEAGGTGSGGTSAGNTRTTPLGGSADPLTIPPEYRDVVEKYFTPAR